ncbi:hypothetical protein B7P43_G03191 [Cryptotermes secundus]|uniref:Uncharacterized protein n=1 Tax=Cryptotermes secundus TaxID=105785 RepID=A0A2J7RTK0_9NEOP|nr:hypothetical protein B7P43_G03191 [Cryptotermes secundus]
MTVNIRTNKLHVHDSSNVRSYQSEHVIIIGSFHIHTPHFAKEQEMKRTLVANADVQKHNCV